MLGWPALSALLLTLSAPGSLDELASEVARQAKPHLQGQTVALYVEAPEAPLARVWLTDWVKAVGQPVTRLHAASMDDAEKQAREQGFSALVRVVLRLKSGTLTAEGDVLSTWVNFWAGQRATRAPSPAGLIFAQTAADAQVLSLLEVSPSLATHSLRIEGARLRTLPQWHSAMACGDLDQDGRGDLSVLYRDRVVVWASSLSETLEWPLTSLPRSPQRAREPTGALVLLPATGTLGVFENAFEEGAVLRFEASRLKWVQKLSEPLFGLNRDREWHATPVLGQNLWQLNEPFPVRFTSMAVEPNWVALTVPPSSVWLIQGDKKLKEIQQVGSLVAFWQPAAKESLGVVVSSPGYSPKEDTVKLLEVAQPHRASGVLWESDPLPGRAVMACTGDHDGDGRQELWVGTWLADSQAEIWLFRSLTP